MVQPLPKLTSLQMNFCTELIKDPANVTAAYRRAVGYDVKGAKQSAHKLMKHPKLVEWVAHQRRLLEKDAAYTLEQCHVDHERAKAMAGNAMEYLKVVESLMKLHSLIPVVKKVSSVNKGFTVENIRAMSNDQITQLLGPERLEELLNHSALG